MTAFDPQAFKRHYPIFTRADAPLHYLDNAATVQMPEAVLKAVVEHETTSRANVKRSLHHLAERATEALERAREAVAAYLGAGIDEIAFTSGCTMALNLVAHGLTPRLGPGDEIAVSPAEHHSNLVPWQRAARATGAHLVPLPLDDRGCLTPDAASVIGPRTRIVALAEASNVTGMVHPVAQIAALAHAHGALVVVDGAQGAAHGPLNAASLGADFYAFSGHKLGAPNGVGALWAGPGLIDSLVPLLTGGEMIRSVSFTDTVYAQGPMRLEAGTPPIAQAIGLGAACQFLAALDQPAVAAHMRLLTARLLAGLVARGGNRLRLIGSEHPNERLPIVSFAITGIHPHDLCHLADRAGVALRGGHLCAQPLHTHLGLTGSTRASLFPYNTVEDVDACLDVVARALELLPAT